MTWFERLLEGLHSLAEEVRDQLRLQVRLHSLSDIRVPVEILAWDSAVGVSWSSSSSSLDRYFFSCDVATL